MEGQNILLSYPRSGNHLVRFFIELLSEIPTYGCRGNPDDKEIYKNIFPENVPFNISDFNKTDCFIKDHYPPRNLPTNKLILIVRNPREAILRHDNYKINAKSFKCYFSNIEYFINHKGKKLLLYYEDILTNKIDFINTLYDFLSVDNLKKKNYVLSNIEKLYHLSSMGKNRAWDGINSEFKINFYYEKIPHSIKEEFDHLLNNEIKKFKFIQEKYNIDVFD